MRCPVRASLHHDSSDITMQQTTRCQNNFANEDTRNVWSSVYLTNISLYWPPSWLNLFVLSDKLHSLTWWLPDAQVMLAGTLTAQHKEEYRINL